MKGTFLDNRLQLNLSAYLMQWNNVQFLFFNPPYLGNTTFGLNGPIIMSRAWKRSFRRC